MYDNLCISTGTLYFPQICLQQSNSLVCAAYRSAVVLAKRYYPAIRIYEVAKLARHLDFSTKQSFVLVLNLMSTTKKCYKYHQGEAYKLLE